MSASIALHLLHYSLRDNLPSIYKMKVLLSASARVARRSAMARAAAQGRAGHRHPDDPQPGLPGGDPAKTIKVTWGFDHELYDGWRPHLIVLALIQMKKDLCVIRIVLFVHFA
jgi:hypothetical protein